MLARLPARFRAHFRHHFVAYIALFVALGGTGYAASKIGSAGIADNSLVSADLKNGAAVKGEDVVDNSLTNLDLKDGAGVKSADVVDESLTASDLKNGAAVKGEDVVDNSLGGADVAESSLGRVPSALVGGLGRSSDPAVRQECDPESTTFANCAYIGLDLPTPARIFVTASIDVQAEGSSSPVGSGTCLLGTTSGNIPFTSIDVSVTSGSKRVAISGVTGVFPAGAHSFGIDCNETAFPVVYHQARVTAIAISDG
jgi:hypothetical protein